MRLIPVRTTIIILWLALLGWFLRYEAFPGWFTGTLNGYRALFSEGQVFMDSWMNIRFKDQDIGFSHMQVEMNEKDPAQRYTITSRTTLTLNLGGEKQLVNVSSVTRLDPLQKLASFDFALASRQYAMTIDGIRKQGDNFRVRIKSDAGRFATMVRIPDDAIIYSPMTMMSLGRMTPGQTIKLRTFDPMNINKGGVAVADVLVKALRRETYTWATNTTDATVLNVTYQGMDMTAWIDPQGRVLREDTPFGWSMTATTPEDALRIDKNTDARTTDLLTAMSVPIRGTIRDIETCRLLRLRLTGLHFPIHQLATARQQIQPETNATATITLTAGANEPDQPLDPATRAEALAPTTYIQSDAPEIKTKAADITRGLTNDLDKALAIKNWVHKSIAKNLTVSIPSALDVLKQRQGDCNEHTYLYVALARAAGLPSQVRVGIVQKDDHYFYHAWPAVHIGHWYELDPTLDIAPLTTRHITLLAGELSSQVKLMSALGQLRVEILDQQY